VDVLDAGEHADCVKLSNVILLHLSFDFIIKVSDLQFYFD